MKKMFLTLLVGAVLALAVASPSEAGDKGPQRQTSVISTNNSVVTIPVSETGRFTPEWIVFNRLPSPSTQAVFWVASGVTGTVSAATQASSLSLSNIPPMFYGDYFLVTANGLLTTNTLDARIIGSLFD